MLPVLHNFVEVPPDYFTSWPIIGRDKVSNLLVVGHDFRVDLLYCQHSKRSFSCERIAKSAFAEIETRFNHLSD